MSVSQNICGEKRRKVLIAVDGSDNSEKAFHTFAQTVYRPGDDMLILLVQDETPVEPWPSSSNYHNDWISIMKSRKEQADYMTDDYRTKCQTYGFDSVEPLMIETGNPGEVICSVAKDEEVDLVVLGSRGKGTIRRTLMGSVSSYCVHHAHVPVMVVPHADRHNHHEVEHFAEM